MMNKKTSLTIAGVVAIIATVSGVYMYENMYSSVSYGVSQYTDIPFDNLLVGEGIIAIGTVIDKEMALLQYDSIDTDENGIEYVADSERKPFQKITLRVDRYFKDTTGNFDSMLTFYEMSTEGMGWDNDQRAMFYVEHPQTYNLGDQNFYFIDKSQDYDKYVINGFAEKYRIITDTNGVKYIQSEIDEMFGHPPRLYSDVVIDALNIGADYMTSEMVEKRDNYKP